MEEKTKGAHCPICNYYFEDKTLEKIRLNQDICPQCYIEFGYEDCAGDDLEYRKRIYFEWRKEWIKAGSQKEWRPSNELVIDIIQRAKKE